jgi:poly(3-hydroxybutyrate) depolymerase
MRSNPAGGLKTTAKAPTGVSKKKVQKRQIRAKQP